MVKKLVLVLGFCMAVFLCACSGSSDVPSSTSTSNTVNSSESAEKDDGIIEFDNVTILNDDVVTVELTQFYEKEVNWAGQDKPSMEKYLTLKVHNNSDGDILFNLNDGYIHDEAVTIIMEDGNSGPAAGKTGTYSYCIQYKASPEDKPLDSLDDLYSLEGNIQTYKEKDNQLSDERNTRFSLAEILNGRTPVSSSSSNVSDQAQSSSIDANSEQAEPKPLSVGETITTDDWEITYVGAELTNEVLPGDTSSVYSSYVANDGSVVLNLMFDVKCLSSEAGSLSDALSKGVATYAGRYTYNTVEPYYDGGNRVSNAKRLALDPLQQLRIDYLIVNIPEEATTNGESITVDIEVAGEERSITVR